MDAQIYCIKIIESEEQIIDKNKVFYTVDVNNKSPIGSPIHKPIRGVKHSNTLSFKKSDIRSLYDEIDFKLTEKIQGRESFEKIYEDSFINNFLRNVNKENVKKTVK